ncbi:MAG: restriction endonuclease subunit S [Bacillota bacterium]|jgi:type I restriction enzyme S subunit
MRSVDGWQSNILGEVCEFIGGNGFPEQLQGRKDGDYPFIKVSDMELPGNKKMIVQANNWIDRKTQTNEAFNICPEFSVVFAKVGAALLLNRRRIITRPTCIDNNMMAAVPSGIQPLFLYYVLSNIDFADLVQSGAVPSINQRQISGISFDMPKLESEQAKIAEVLSTVDRAIEQTESLIAKQQRIKTGLMHDLLTRGIDEHGRLRSEETHQFKDSPLGRIPVEWEVKRLFELVDIAEGQKDPTKEPYRDWPLVAPDHVESGTGLLLSLITAREQRAISGKYEFAPGDIVYSKIRPYLRKAVLVDFVGLCSADMYPMRPKGKTTSEFILLTILGERFSKYAESVSERSGFPKINRSELASFVVATPLAAEQKRMASFSNKFAKSFELEKRLLTKLRSLKTALMQDLLTGKVRVTPLLDSTEVMSE